jgi:hypothetical protein
VLRGLRDKPVLPEWPGSKERKVISAPPVLMVSMVVLTVRMALKGHKGMQAQSEQLVNRGYKARPVLPEWPDPKEYMVKPAPPVLMVSMVAQTVRMVRMMRMALKARKGMQAQSEQPVNRG